jgi:phosphoserine aminotransferase
MTSSLGARTDIPWDQTALIYASAQKNFGIAGASVVIIKKEFLENSKKLTTANYLGRALTYSALFEAKSALNTPPVMPIYVMNRMLQWIKNSGGAEMMENKALEKANLIYQHFDSNFYIGRAFEGDRSRHNFVFNLQSQQLEKEFIEEAAKNNILEIKGYKSIGGIRVSVYNGVDLESVKVLSEFMREFKLAKGF